MQQLFGKLQNQCALSAASASGLLDLRLMCTAGPAARQGLQHCLQSAPYKRQTVPITTATDTCLHSCCTLLAVRSALLAMRAWQAA
jgi:hypothetical protein